MASNYTELSKETTLQTDEVVVVKHLAGIPGGRSLDLSEYKNAKHGTDLIKAGHIIVKNTTTGVFAPLSVSDQAKYEAVPEGSEIVGVLEYSVRKEEPIGAILTAGQVNGKALPYPLPEDGKSKLPRIEFLYI